ncbi:phage late control D family protein [Desulfitobacterium chlororespirans]|uniref:Phage protein D n=1 Tax=Desulfitobacterium chlororespirans DSM 11544 TaxID=1121395 RepID=A0A1M7TQW3_9FIRM|nr:phage late control D family protein [Desulfitobacterium chlororespirans]SHN73129.1 Phage protein D [Desulfitobacterium chlororespirans DSM 11544]
MKAPRAILEVSGVNVKWQDILDISLENTLYLAADSFEVTLRNDLLLSDWFRKQQEVKVYFGYVDNPESWTKGELTHLLTGRIDGIKPEWSGKKIVKLIGRDYSAPMIDTEYSVAFENQTSGQIAGIMAKKYGLKPIITHTGAIADKELITNKKEWEVLQALADLEGFVCYVTKDKELYFGPRKETDETVIARLYNLGPGQVNCTLNFDDSTVDVINKVTVRHWLGANKKLIEGSAVNESLLSAMGGQLKERIVYESKAKTPALAKEYAEKRLKEWSRNVVTAEGLCALNPEIAAERKVLCQGFGRFEGEYYLNQVTHSLSKSSGAKTEFNLTNLRPDEAEQYRQDLYEDHGEIRG